MLLGALLLVVALLYAVDVARGGPGEPEAGEDVDLTQRRSTGARCCC